MRRTRKQRRARRIKRVIGPARKAKERPFRGPGKPIVFYSFDEIGGDPNYEALDRIIEDHHEIWEGRRMKALDRKIMEGEK